MNTPRFIFETESEESEFTRVQPGNYLQVTVEEEPASALSLTAGSFSPKKCFIFETKPTSSSGQE
jgi:hypothetical protein